MRIVHTADWHIGKNLNDYSLLEDQRVWFSRLIDRLAKLLPDALIVAGDIYDRSMPSGEAVSLLNEILQAIVLDLHIETYLIAGNHDSRERLSFGSGLLEKSGLHIGGRLSPHLSPYPLTRDGVTAHIYLLPYLEPYHLKPLFPGETIRTQQEAVERITREMRAQLSPDAFHILVAHGLFTASSETGLSDASVGGSELVNASFLSGFDYVALGHLHSGRSIGLPQMRYAGSPLKYSVDEAGQTKSITILDIAAKGEYSLSTESIPPLRDVRTVQGAFAQLLQPQPQENREDYVFALLEDREIILNAINRLKAVYPHILGLKYLNRIEAPMEKLAFSKGEAQHLTEEELFAGFYQAVADKPLSCEQEKLVENAFRQLKGGGGHDTDQADA